AILGGYLIPGVATYVGGAWLQKKVAGWLSKSKNPMGWANVLITAGVGGLTVGAAHLGSMYSDKGSMKDTWTDIRDNAAIGVVLRLIQNTTSALSSGTGAG